MSILIGVGAGAGRYRGSQPRAKTSMMIMRAPQRGQVQGCTRGSSGAAACSFLGSTFGGTIAVGEEAIVADPVEALGQHVHQEAADELMR